MTPQDSDFITNVANETAREILKKLKRAAEHFKDDPECATKCFTMQCNTIIFLIYDYLEVLHDACGVSQEELLRDIMQDVTLYIEKCNERHN